MSNELILALFSLGITAMVSILAALVPICIDSRKSKRKMIEASVNRIYEKAEKLSANLAKFRNPEHLKEIHEEHSARAELRASHDAWEMAIFPKLNQDQRNKRHATE